MYAAKIFFLSNKRTDAAGHVLMNAMGVGEKVWNISTTITYRLGGNVLTPMKMPPLGNVFSTVLQVSTKTKERPRALFHCTNIFN